LTLDLYADNANRTAYAARTLAFAANYERQTTILFQKPWTWSLGMELQASAEREGTASGILTGRTNYFTAAVPLRGAYDASDDLLNPKRGWRVSLRISPEISKALAQTSPYARLQFDASGYLPMGKGTVAAARARLGVMPGTAIANIAPSRRFYAGGGGSLRGFGYQLVGPRNAVGDPMGGRSLYEFSLEARVHTGLFGGALTLVPFLDAGGVDADSMPRFKDMRYGAGLGLRYQTGFGPIRVDVGTPLNRRVGESRIGVYVALGQAF
jgi:translocation and assembly module TamA